MRGLKLAALYGFYPHWLGFCGSRKKSTREIILNYLSAKKVSEKKVREILEGFKAAFSYYKLIAESNNIKDPFNEKVVKAYWIGNELLESVSIDSLREMIIKEFSKPGLLSLEAAKEKAKKAAFSSKAHHSFHVLVIGSVTGRVVLEGKLLDICRIGWGNVTGYKKNKGENGLVVKYRSLQQKNGRYSLANPSFKFVFWDKKLISKIKIGDIVTTHWGHVVQTISKKDLNSLEKYTQLTIDSLGAMKK